MDKQNQPIVAHHDIAEGSYRSYVTGFLLSIILTLIPYFLVVNEVVSGWTLTACLLGFACAQLMVQLVFFLHLGKESKPRWNLLVLLFAIMVVLIVVIGSLWIMKNLNYNMTSHEVNEYIQEEEAIRR